MPSAFDDFISEFEDYYRSRSDTQSGNTKNRPSMQPSMAYKAAKGDFVEAERRNPQQPPKAPLSPQSKAYKASIQDEDTRLPVMDPLNARNVPRGVDPLKYLESLGDRVDQRALYAFIESEEGRKWASLVMQDQATQERAIAEIERRMRSESEGGIKGWLSQFENPGDAFFPDEAGKALEAVLHPSRVGQTDDGSIDFSHGEGEYNYNLLPGYQAATSLQQGLTIDASTAAELLGTTQRSIGMLGYLLTPDINDQAKRANGPDVYSMEGLKWLWEQTREASLAQIATGIVTSGGRATDSTPGSQFDPNVFAPTMQDTYSIFDPLQKEQLKSNGWYSTGTGAADLGIQVTLAVTGDRLWSKASTKLGLKGGLMNMRDLGAAEQSLQAHLEYRATDGASGRETWFGQQAEAIAAMNDMVEIKNHPLVYKSVNRVNVANLLADVSDAATVGRILLADRGDRASLLALMADAPSYVYRMSDVERLWMKEEFNTGRVALTDDEHAMFQRMFEDDVMRDPSLAQIDAKWHERVLEDLGSIADDAEAGERLIPKRGYSLHTNDPLSIRGVFNEAQGGTPRMKGIGLGFHESMADLAYQRDAHQLRIHGNTRGTGRPVSRYLSFVTDRNALNMVTFSSLRPGDAITEMSTWISKSRAFKGAKRVPIVLAVAKADGTIGQSIVEMNREEFTAHWQKKLTDATSDSDKARVIRETEREVMSAEILHYRDRLHVDDLGAFIDTITGARDEHIGQIQKRGYAFTPSQGGRLIYEPMFVRQLADSVPLTDLNGLHSVLRATVRRAKDAKVEQAAASSGVKIKNAAEVAYAMWRTGVLFNPKYTLKNAIFEPLLASTLSAGSDYVWDTITHFGAESRRATANIAEAVINTALRVSQPFTPTDLRARRALKIERRRELALSRRMESEPGIAAWAQSPQRQRIRATMQRHAEARAAYDIALADYYARRAAAGMPDAQGMLSFENFREFYTQEAVRSGKAVYEPRAFFNGNESGDGWVYLPDGTRRWGLHGGGGALIRHVDADGVERFLLGQRAAWVSGGGGKWSVPGGALDFGETPALGALREVEEELGLTFPSHTVLGDVVAGDVGAWKYTTSVIDVPERLDPPDGWGSDGETTAVGWYTRQEMEALDLMDQFREALPDIYNRIETKPGAKSTVLDTQEWATDEDLAVLAKAGREKTRMERAKERLERIVTVAAKDDPAYARKRIEVDQAWERLTAEQEAMKALDDEMDALLPGWNAWKPKGLADATRRAAMLNEILDHMDNGGEIGEFRLRAKALDDQAAKRGRKAWEDITKRRQRAVDRILLSLDRDRAEWHRSVEDQRVAARLEHDDLKAKFQSLDAAWYDVDSRYRAARQRPVVDAEPIADDLEITDAEMAVLTGKPEPLTPEELLAGFDDGSKPVPFYPDDEPLADVQNDVPPPPAPFVPLSDMEHVALTKATGWDYQGINPDVPTSAGVTLKQYAGAAMYLDKAAVEFFLKKFKTLYYGDPAYIPGVMDELTNGGSALQVLGEHPAALASFHNWLEGVGADAIYNEYVNAFPENAALAWEKAKKRHLYSGLPVPPPSTFKNLAPSPGNPVGKFNGLTMDEWSQAITDMGSLAEDWVGINSVDDMEQVFLNAGWGPSTSAYRAGLVLDALNDGTLLDLLGKDHVVRNVYQQWIEQVHTHGLYNTDSTGAIQKVLDWGNSPYFESWMPPASEFSAGKQAAPAPAPASASGAPGVGLPITRTELEALKIERDTLFKERSAIDRQMQDAAQRLRAIDRIVGRTFLEPDAPWDEWADVTFGLTQRPESTYLWQSDKDMFEAYRTAGPHDLPPTGTAVFHAGWTGLSPKKGGGGATGEMFNGTVGTHWSLNPDTSKSFGSGSDVVFESVIEHPSQWVDPKHASLMDGSRARPLENEYELRLKQNAPARVVRVWVQESKTRHSLNDDIERWQRGEPTRGWRPVEMGNGVPVREARDGSPAGRMPRHHDAYSPTFYGRADVPAYYSSNSDVDEFLNQAGQRKMSALQRQKEWESLAKSFTAPDGRTVEYLPGTGTGEHGVGYHLGVEKIGSGGDALFGLVRVDLDTGEIRAFGSGDYYQTQGDAAEGMARNVRKTNPDLNTGLVFDDAEFDMVDPSKQAPVPPRESWPGGPTLYHGSRTPIRNAVLEPSHHSHAASMWMGRGMYAADDVDVATFGYARGSENVYNLQWKALDRNPVVLDATKPMRDDHAAQAALSRFVDTRLQNVINELAGWRSAGGSAISKDSFGNPIVPSREDAIRLAHLMVKWQQDYANPDMTVEQFIRNITIDAMETDATRLSEYALRAVHSELQRQFIRDGYDVVRGTGGGMWGDSEYGAFNVLEPHRWRAVNVGSQSRVTERRWMGDEAERAETWHNVADYIEGDNPQVGNARVYQSGVPTGEGVVLPEWITQGRSAVAPVRVSALRDMVVPAREGLRDDTGAVVVRFNPNTQRATVVRNQHLLAWKTDGDYVPVVVENPGLPQDGALPPREGLSEATEGWVSTPGRLASVPTPATASWPIGNLHPALIFERGVVARPSGARKPSTLRPLVKKANEETQRLTKSLNDTLTGTRGEYEATMSAFDELSNLIDRSRRRQAEIRQSRVRDPWVAPWRDQGARKGEGMAKATIRSQDGSKREVRFPELFQGSLGASYRDEFSASNTVLQNYDPSRVTRMTQAKNMEVMSTDGLHQPGDAAYWNEMAHWIDRTLKGDPLAVRIAAGQSDAQILAWLQTSNSGKRYARQMKWDEQPDWADSLTESEPMLPGMDRDLGATGRTMIGEARRVVESYLPTPELRRWAATYDDKVIDAKAVEAKFSEEQVPIGSLSPIHANEYASVIDLNGQQAGLKVIDRMWTHLATNPENAVGRFPWSAWQYRREMKDRLQQYSDQGLDLTPAQINAIRHDAARAVLDEMEKTFYTIRRQNSLLFAARWVTAFPQAQANAIYRFTRLAARRPGTAAVVANAWIGAYQNWGVDQDGNPVGDNWNDMKYMVFDVPPALAEKLQSIPGVSSAVGDLNQVKISRQGIDYLSTPPSSSIFVTVPAATLLNNAPDVDSFIRKTPGAEAFYKFVFPFADDFGVDQKETGIPTSNRSTFDLGGMTVDVTGAVPTSFRRAFSLINTSDDEAQKAVIASWQYLQSKWLQGGGAESGQTEPTLEDAQHMARGVLLQNFLASQTIPGLRVELPGQQYRDAWTKIRDKEPDYQKAVATALDQYGPWMIWYTTSMRSTNFGLGASYSTDAYDRIKNHASLAETLASLAEDGRMVSLLVQDADTTFNAAVYNYYQDNSIPGGNTLIREPYDPTEFARRVKAQTGWQIYAKSQENLFRLMEERGVKTLQDAEAGDLRAAWSAYKDDLGQKYPEWDAERQSINTGRAGQTVRGLTMMVADKEWMKEFENSPYTTAIVRYLSERQNALEQRATTSASKTVFDAAWDAYVIDNILPLSPDFRDVYSRNLQGSDLK